MRPLFPEIERLFSVKRKKEKVRSHKKREVDSGGMKMEKLLKTSCDTLDPAVPEDSPPWSHTNGATVLFFLRKLVLTFFFLKF